MEVEEALLLGREAQYKLAQKVLEGCGFSVGLHFFSKVDPMTPWNGPPIENAHKPVITVLDKKVRAHTQGP